MSTETVVLGLVALGIVTLGWIAASFARRHGARASQSDAWLNRLFDKFENADQLVAFLDSPTGRDLLETMRNGRAGLRNRMLGLLQVAILLLSLSAAFAFIKELPGLGGDANTPLSALAILCASLGVGFLVSCALAWILARAWGMTATSRRPSSDR